MLEYLLIEEISEKVYLNGFRKNKYLKQFFFHSYNCYILGIRFLFTNSKIDRKQFCLDSAVAVETILEQIVHSFSMYKVWNRMLWLQT